MRCYMVKTTGCARLAATGGEARAFRQAMVDEREDVKKKDVEINPVELKTAKPELLALVNGLLEQLDDNTDFEMPEQVTLVDKDAKKAEREAKKEKVKPVKAEAPKKEAAKPTPVKKSAPAKKAAPVKKAPAKKPAKKR